MAIELYMLADQVPGIHKIDSESDFATDQKKFIRLETFAQGISRPAALIRPSALKAGIRAARVEHGNIVATRKFDPSSMALMQAHVQGLTLSSVHIFGCRVLKDPKSKDRKPRPLLHVMMSDVVIAEFDYAVMSESASETIEFRYSSIGWRLRSVERGSATDDTKSWTECWWNGKKNEATRDEDVFTAAMLNTDKVFDDAGF